MKIYHFFLGLLTVGTILTSCGKDNDEPNGQPKPSTENNTNKNIVTSGLPSEITLLEFPKVKGDSNNPIIVHKVNEDRKSTRLNSSHANISYAVFCLKKKKNTSFVATDHYISYTHPYTHPL